MIAIDQLSYDSKLRDRNAGEKFAYAAMTLTLCVLNRSIFFSAVVLLLNMYLIVSKSGVHLHRFWHFLRLPLVFLLLSTLVLGIHIAERPLDAFAIPIGDVYLTSGWSSLRLALQLILTALASVTCLYFLAFTTPMPDILSVLRRLHCPKLILELMLLIYRFIFVLQETAQAILTAQEARLGNCNFKTACRSFGSMGCMLFIHAFKRSNRLFDAMEARCFDGTIRVLEEKHPPKKKEIIWIVGVELFLILLSVIRYRYESMGFGFGEVSGKKWMI